MAKHGSKGPFRYLTVHEMMQRIEELRAERAGQQADSAEIPELTRDYEQWEAEHGRQIGENRDPRDAENPERAPTEFAAPPDEEKFVWIGDDFAVHLEGAGVDLDADEDEAIVAPPVADAQVSAARESRWSVNSYAIGAAALSIMAVVAVGTLFSITPARDNALTMASSVDLRLGQTPDDQIPPSDAITTMVVIPDLGQESVAARLRFRPQHAERAIRDALAARGFRDVGVSAGARGDVYLAGPVYSLAEARYIVRVARRTVGSANVHFLHPDLRQPVGPAYFGATTVPAPDVWGAKVTAVVIGSPAFEAGMRPGDVIRGFDHEVVPTADALDAMLEEYHPGDRVDVRVWRNGADHVMIVRLGELTEMALR
jgi:PDZ domain